MNTEANTSEVTEQPLNTHKIVTLYIHGFSNDGVLQEGIYGIAREDISIQEQIGDFGYTLIDEEKKSDKLDNLFTTIEYYGDTPPFYYTSEDIKEVEKSEKGIPRYALIVAKYIKYLIETRGVTEINIMSASMGSLVSRYLIEKNIHQLTSEKYIRQWLSFEGVVKGNIAASNETLYDLTSFFKSLSIDTEHMKYDWINQHLDEKSPLYDGLKIGFESSTKDNLNQYALSVWLRTVQGKYMPNDGYQVVQDTFFENYPHTLLHENHLSLSDNKAAWASAVLFFHSNKHIRVTLSEVTLHTLYEQRTLLNDGIADVVFESRIYSPYAARRWGIEKAVDERVYEGKYPKLYHYEKTEIPYSSNIVLFDGMIVDDETTLKVNIQPIELDLDVDYGVLEAIDKTKNKSFEKLEYMLPTKEGVYEFDTQDWGGRLKVEVVSF